MIWCYTGAHYEKFYMLERSKRLVWDSYSDRKRWSADFEDLRGLYRVLFDEWDNPDCWEESAIFEAEK